MRSELIICYIYRLKTRYKTIKNVILAEKRIFLKKKNITNRQS